MQGFTTLASSTVSEVSGQQGVAAAAGGLNLSVVKVSGTFTRGQFQQNGKGGAGGYGLGRGGSGGRPRADRQPR
ncbi:hypothetical protein [Streptomyces sp. NPDC001056]